MFARSDLTSICTQCVHIRPTTMVPTIPKARPPFLKAKGMARIPDPKLLLSKCARAPKSLKNEERICVNLK